MSAISITRPGLLTTVQDLGRWGWQAAGVPVSGVMDRQSSRIANALVGNAPGAALLEITLAGPQIEFHDDRLIAVAGATFAMDLDGTAVTVNEVIRVRSGSRLTFGERKAGARAYFAISGGIETADVLGSRSTHLGSAMGGFDGRALKAGDRLPLGHAAPARERVRTILDQVFLTSESNSSKARVRVVSGPESDRFEKHALMEFQSAPYRVGNQSNRMGFRLEGPAVAGPSDIVSDITTMGTLQVPSSGQPILLMADRQTTGGYPRIAHVITADLPKVAQLAPGDEMTFTVCTHAEAHDALVQSERQLRALEARPVE